MLHRLAEQKRAAVHAVLSELVRCDHLADLDQRRCIAAVAEVRARRHRATASCRFQRPCLQANGREQEIRTAPLSARVAGTQRVVGDVLVVRPEQDAEAVPPADQGNQRALLLHA